VLGVVEEGVLGVERRGGDGDTHLCYYLLSVGYHRLRLIFAIQA
jgi:hypothetical protein